MVNDDKTYCQNVGINFSINKKMMDQNKNQLNKIRNDKVFKNILNDLKDPNMNEIQIKKKYPKNVDYIDLIFRTIQIKQNNDSLINEMNNKCKKYFF